MKKTFFIFCSILVHTAGFAQQQDSSLKKINAELLQFTGLVLTPDSLKGIPNVSIRVSDGKGTVSNEEGFFSLVARKGDTILFSSIGYRPEYYVVPQTLAGKKYTMIQTMSEDTIFLNVLIVRPYISKELFQHYFVTMKVPEDAGDIAMENLDPETIRQYSEQMQMDGAENQKYTLRQESNRYYYTGQLPPINLLNPFAWAQFIKAWKDGKLKRE